MVGLFGESGASADELIKNSENIRLALYNNFVHNAELQLHSTKSRSPTFVCKMVCTVCVCFLAKEL